MSAAPDVLQQLTEGVIVRPMLPCRRAVDRYLGDLLRLGKRPRTIDTYRRCLDDFTDTLPADWDIAKVTANEVRAFLDKYNRKSPAYRAQKDSILRAFFKWLYREELIRRSPMERMQPPKRQRDEDKDVLTVSSSDVRKLLSECRDWRERITLSVLAYMGPRRHAASQLRLSDYDGGRLRFREKGGKTIWKPVPSELAELLDAALAAGVYNASSGSVGVPGRGTSLEERSAGCTLACPDPESYLIPSNQPQRREGDRDDRVVWRTVRAVAERAGVKAHTHALRAAFAVFYLEANPGEVESLKELMGHRSILTTQTYLRRLDRVSAMERVRTLSWQVSGVSAFEAKSMAEKEGFEPSINDNVLSKRPGPHPCDVDLQTDLQPKRRERA